MSGFVASNSRWVSHIPTLIVTFGPTPLTAYANRTPSAARTNRTGGPETRLDPEPIGAGWYKALEIGSPGQMSRLSGGNATIRAHDAGQLPLGADTRHSYSR